MDIKKQVARLHRFKDQVAIEITYSTGTVYLTPENALEIADGLIDLANDIKSTTFTKSTKTTKTITD